MAKQTESTGQAVDFTHDAVDFLKGMIGHYFRGAQTGTLVDVSAGRVWIRHTPESGLVSGDAIMFASAFCRGDLTFEDEATEESSGLCGDSREEMFHPDVLEALQMLDPDESEDDSDSEKRQG